MTPSPKRVAHLAAEYIDRGWPIARLAAPRNGRCQCGGTCTEAHLLDGEPIQTVAEVQDWGDYEIAVLTSQFEVLDLPAPPGVALNGALMNRCPTAVARPNRRFDTLLEPGPVRWHFYLSPGSADAEKVARLGGTLHHGPDDWIAAPPSRTPSTGRVRWNVHPMQTQWRPYTKTDVFGTIGIA